jgi:hypothetical protein
LGARTNDFTAAFGRLSYEQKKPPQPKLKRPTLRPLRQVIKVISQQFDQVMHTQ